MSKQKTIKRQELIFYNPTDSTKPLLFFEIVGGEKDVEEAMLRVRNQVLRMQNGVWEEQV